jgi:hypothetical protein
VHRQNSAPMLTESDVIDAVSTFLHSQGYEIRQKLSPLQRGHDIIAFKRGTPDRALYIEAKGGTSSKPTTKRYGKPFNGAQVRVHVAEAFYKAATALCGPVSSMETRVGIAFPSTQKHFQRIRDIEPVLRQLKIAIFWVAQDRQVQFVSPWDL